MKSSGMAYLLWCACLFGGCGIHRLYLGKYVSGALYFFTFGLFGIGQLIDLFRIPDMVARINLEQQIQPGAPVNIYIQQENGSPARKVESAYEPTTRAKARQPAAAGQTIQNPQKALETTVLQLARTFQGRLTAVELSTNSVLSLEQAEKELENFVRKGYAEMIVTKSGSMVYEFPGFLHFNQSAALNPPKPLELDDEERI